MNKETVTLWGREFNIVKSGLSEAQVASFVDGLAKEHDELIQRQGHLSTLTRLAERTASEAEKLAEEIKSEAVDEAKKQVDKIMAEAEAQAQQLIEEKRAEILTKVNEEAEAIKANAEREAKLLLDRQTKGIKLGRPRM